MSELFRLHCVRSPKMPKFSNSVMAFQYLLCKCELPASRLISEDLLDSNLNIFRRYPFPNPWPLF